MSLFTRIFPPPPFVTLPAVGIDFSDTIFRFVQLEKSSGMGIPLLTGEVAIPVDCIHDGRVNNEKAFTEFLKTIKKKYAFKYVRVAIPESQIYSFTVTLDQSTASDIRSAIELTLEDNIPLKAIETVFDFSILKTTTTSIIVQVEAVSENVVNTLFSCYTNAGFIPVSFELDVQAITRAVVTQGTKEAHMVVDIGAHRTSITIGCAGSIIYTATVEFGGDMLTEELSNKLSLTKIQAEELKRTVGLSHTPKQASFFEALSKSITPLKEEIERRYIYWQEKKEGLGGFPTITTIFICGGHSNLHGLIDYLNAELKLSVVQANPWINCFSFEEYIPEMSFESSMSYVTGIGLALNDFVS